MDQSGTGLGGVSITFGDLHTFLGISSARAFSVQGHEKENVMLKDTIWSKDLLIFWYLLPF